MTAQSAQPEIKIDDLVVRPWRDDDAPAVFAACQDPAIQRWTTIPRPYEMAHAVGFVGPVSTDAWETGSGADFGVFDDATGALLGSMGLVKLDLASREAELGYWTTPAARGRGVATRAGRAVAQWATNLLGIERLVWRAEVGNHASRLVALRIGFTMEGLGRGNLRHADGSRLDGWTGSLRPGEVISATPPQLARGSLLARQAEAFGQAQPVLPTEIGSLRPHRDDDIPHAVAALSDPETQRWTTAAVNDSKLQTERLIRVDAPEIWSRGTGAVYAIADADDTYCGSIDLRIDAHDGRIGEIGFQVAPWARGRGVAPAAARTIAAWAFDSLGLARVVWRAHVGNEASRRVAEKAGLVFEGTERSGLDHRGTRRDAWVASLVATDPR